LALAAAVLVRRVAVATTRLVRRFAIAARVPARRAFLATTRSFVFTKLLILSASAATAPNVEPIAVATFVNIRSSRVDISSPHRTPSSQFVFLEQFLPLKSGVTSSGAAKRLRSAKQKQHKQNEQNGACAIAGVVPPKITVGRHGQITRQQNHHDGDQSDD
jgi:hypothetical protein